MNKVLFLDRDGVINKDHRYVNQISDFEFMPGIFEITKHFQNLGYLIIVVTNQAGVSKGYYKESDLINITKWMISQFRDRGITISKVYYETSFDENHPRRKPNPGMFIDAIKEFNVDPLSSLMVGDKTSDLIAAHRAGIKKNIFLKGKYSFVEVDFDVEKVDSLLQILKI